MKFFSFIFSFLILCPVLVSAETVVRVGESVAVDAEQVVAGDYYVSVGPIGNTTMSGTVEGDMYAVGGSVTVNGVVAEDLSVVSGVSQLHASVTDDVRIVSGEVIVAEHIGGDLFVLGRVLKVLSTASIDGNVYFFGSDAKIEGAVGGSVFGTADKLRIDGPVAGKVNVKIYSQFTLGSKAVVKEDVIYVSHNEVVRSIDTVVEGEVRQEKHQSITAKENLQNRLVPIFTSLIATLTLYLLFRREISVMIAALSGHYPRAGLIGLGVILLAPIASVMLMLTILGLLVGGVMAATTIVLLIVGYAIAPIVIGSYLSFMVTKQEQVSLVWLLVGAVVIHVAALIPVIGVLVILGAYAVSVGMLTISLYRLLG